jgi:hypothetical protein
MATIKTIQVAKPHPAQTQTGVSAQHTKSMGQDAKSNFGNSISSLLAADSSVTVSSTVLRWLFRSLQASRQKFTSDVWVAEHIGMPQQDSFLPKETIAYLHCCS